MSDYQTIEHQGKERKIDNRKLWQLKFRISRALDLAIKDQNNNGPKYVQRAEQVRKNWDEGRDHPHPRMVLELAVEVTSQTIISYLSDEKVDEAFLDMGISPVRTKLVFIDDKKEVLNAVLTFALCGFIALIALLLLIVFLQ